MLADGPLPRSAEVVVVGGGPAGAATAWWLARAGIDVVVLDKARFPRPKPCSEYCVTGQLRIIGYGSVGDLSSHAAIALPSRSAKSYSERVKL